jgi:glycopeptide antibiotics resistance protein
MLLFIPFSFILIMIFRITNARVVIGLAFLTSVALEIAQYVFRLGVADVDDVILNTTGAIIGFYLCRGFFGRLNTQS